ncbi:DUF1778 domain-containing protein [Serratia sp. NPDC087055]|uniref:type II toxin-antitoxin system TacA family antitoxin n=1 Tax=Serratia sp. NPDC087055 TaxID=3364516 RepID=UPI00384C1BF5
MPKQKSKPLINRGNFIYRSTLNLRIKSEDKALIDRAARAAGKNRAEFILEAARLAAEETLANLRIVNISPDVYKQFLDKLDMSPQTNEALRKTMQSQPPWEN